MWRTALRAGFRSGEFRKSLDSCRACRQYGGSSPRTIPLALAARALARFNWNTGRDDDAAAGIHTTKDEFAHTARG